VNAPLHTQGGLQDKVKTTCKDINPEKKDAKLTPFEMMFYSNFSGAVFAIAVAAATGQLQSGLAFVTRSPALLKAIMTFACCSALVTRLFPVSKPTIFLID
jgi:hypothetical protein